uniref:Sulfatase N-terminal domain-containing protein n=1 Tax=Ditylenchus dipsaci TaxID=166011 RepID=A0A915CMT1_9BILA
MVVMSFMGSKTFLLVVLVTSFLVFCVVNSNYFVVDVKRRADFAKFAKSAVPKQQYVLEECVLPRIDPWDPSIVAFIEPYKWMQQDNCSVTYPQITSLIEGYVRIVGDRHDILCDFRCLYPLSDYESTKGEWKSIADEPDCDIVEVRCKNKSSADGSYFYNYMHTQIFTSRDLPKSKVVLSEETRRHKCQPGKQIAQDQHYSKTKPDVHILVLDAVSHTQFLRSMQRTQMYLRERMEAISIPHLNKVGKNSRPNAYAFLMGQHSQPIAKNPMGPEISPAKDLSEWCQTPLDDHQFIGFQFQKQGYKTLMSEDMTQGVFNYFGCTGFIRAPVDHYMRPFHLRINASYKSYGNEIRDNVLSKSCKEWHHYHFEYLQQFLEKYEQQPKFSLTWLSYVAHDDKLENAFVFIMGDHGQRVGEIHETPIGVIEDNNPLLFMVLPKYLRENTHLLKNLRENSRQLISQYDVYATLTSIVKNGENMTPESKFDQLKTDEWDMLLHGSSMLYPFEKEQARHCGNLMIPFEVCQCQFQQANLTNSHSSLATRLANFVVEGINLALDSSEIGSMCATLKLDLNTPVQILELEPDKHTNVVFTTVPGNARLWTFVQADPTYQEFKLIANSTRMNSYDSQAFCVPDTNLIHFYRNFVQANLRLEELPITESTDFVLLDTLVLHSHTI